MSRFDFDFASTAAVMFPVSKRERRLPPAWGGALDGLDYTPYVAPPATTRCERCLGWREAVWYEDDEPRPPELACDGCGFQQIIVHVIHEIQPIGHVHGGG